MESPGLLWSAQISLVVAFSAESHTTWNAGEGGNGTADHSQGASLFGRRMTRVEDGPLLRGQGRFVDDIKLPGALHAAFLRSPMAHARLQERSTRAQREALPGVRAVFTYADLRPHLTCDRIPLALPSGAIRFPVDPYPLAHDELTYVGEPIALVVAESRAIAEDALRLIDIDAEPLPRGHRSGRGLGARRAARASRLPGQSRRAAHHQIWRCRCRVRQRRASHRRALPAGQRRRPFARDARHRRALRSRRRLLTDLGQHPDAASREIHPGRCARP